LVRQEFLRFIGDRVGGAIFNLYAEGANRRQRQRDAPAENRGFAGKVQTLPSARTIPSSRRRQEGSVSTSAARRLPASRRTRPARLACSERSGATGAGHELVVRWLKTFKLLAALDAFLQEHRRCGALD